MFTDGELRPKRGSPYVGRTFASVLGDLKIGPETKVFVRLVGAGKLTVARPQISVLTAAPDWKSHYQPAGSAAEAIASGCKTELGGVVGGQRCGIDCGAFGSTRFGGE